MRNSEDVIKFLELKEKEEKKLGRKLTDFEKSVLSEKAISDIYSDYTLTKEESDLEIEAHKD